MLKDSIRCSRVAARSLRLLKRPVGSPPRRDGHPWTFLSYLTPVPSIVSEQHTFINGARTHHGSPTTSSVTAVVVFTDIIFSVVAAPAATAGPSSWRPPLLLVSLHTHPFFAPSPSSRLLHLYRPFFPSCSPPPPPSCLVLAVPLAGPQPGSYPWARVAPAGGPSVGVCG